MYYFSICTRILQNKLFDLSNLTRVLPKFFLQNPQKRIEFHQSKPITLFLRLLIGIAPQANSNCLHTRNLANTPKQITALFDAPQAFTRRHAVCFHSLTALHCSSGQPQPTPLNSTTTGDRLQFVLSEDTPRYWRIRAEDI